MKCSKPETLTHQQSLARKDLGYEARLFSGVHDLPQSAQVRTSTWQARMLQNERPPLIRSDHNWFVSGALLSEKATVRLDCHRLES